MSHFLLPFLSPVATVKTKKKFRTAPSRQPESARRYPPSQTFYLRPSNLECKQMESSSNARVHLCRSLHTTSMVRSAGNISSFAHSRNIFQQARWRSVFRYLSAALRVIMYYYLAKENPLISHNYPYIYQMPSSKLQSHTDSASVKLPIVCSLSVDLSWQNFPRNWAQWVKDHDFPVIAGIVKASIFDCLQIWWNRIPVEAYLGKFNLVNQ